MNALPRFLRRAGGLLLVLASACVTVHANDAMMRGAREIESRFQRQFDDIDSRQEQERIKLNSRVRDERAKLQRAAQAAVGKTLVLTGGDPATMARLQFEEAELANRVQHDWERELERRFDRERATLERRKALENAKLAAEYFEAGDDTARLRSAMEKGAQITDRWQAKLDDLRFEESAALDAAYLAGKTKENLAARAMAEWMAKRIAQAQTEDSAQVFNVLGDPAYLELTAKRDDARNATETEHESLRAQFDDRRRELERQRDEEMSGLME